MGVRKRAIAVLCAVLLAFFVMLPFAACGDSQDDGGSGGVAEKPTGNVEQDLSMFDTIPHYDVAPLVVYTLTISGDNATFADGSKSVSIAEDSLLPNIVCTNDGEYVIGVKYVGTGKEVKDYRFRMPAEDTTIEIVTSSEKPPYFAELSPGTSGFDYNSSGDDTLWEEVAFNIEANSPFTMNAEYDIKVIKTGTDIDGNGSDDFLRGNVLEISGVAGNFARMLSSVGTSGSEEGIIAGETYTFTYNFENFGENEISFCMYQTQTTIRLGVTGDKGAATAVNAGRTITLGAGESVSYNISFTADGDNGNIIPVLELRSTFKKEKLGIAIAKENKELSCTHEITKIDAEDGDCGRAGNVEYYGCALCGGMWSDAEGQNPVAMTDVTVKKEHTTGEQYGGIGQETHRDKCSVCGGVVGDAAKHELRYVVIEVPTQESDGRSEEKCVKCGYATGNEMTLTYDDYYNMVGVYGTEVSVANSIGAGLPDEIAALLDDEFFDTETMTVYTKSDFAMPDRDVTLRNFDEPIGTGILPLEKKGSSADAGPHCYDGCKAELKSREDTAVVTEDGRAVKGRELTFTNPTGVFRIDANYTPDAQTLGVDGMVFHLTIQNRTNATITFGVGQVNSVSNKVDGAYVDDVTLKHGETKTFTLTFPDGKGWTNANALTLFDFADGTPSEVTIAMALSYEPKA